MSVAPCFQKGFTFIASLMLIYPGDTGNILHIFKIDNKAQIGNAYISNSYFIAKETKAQMG